MTQDLQKTLEFGAKWLPPVGVLLIIGLQGQFVSRSEFAIAAEKLSGRVENIEKVLVQMTEAAKVNDRQDRLLTDHEDRIRGLEKREHEK
jgi:hypothetical protein